MISCYYASFQLSFAPQLEEHQNRSGRAKKSLTARNTDKNGRRSIKTEAKAPTKSSMKSGTTSNYDKNASKTQTSKGSSASSAKSKGTEGSKAKEKVGVKLKKTSCSLLTGCYIKSYTITLMN